MPEITKNGDDLPKTPRWFWAVFFVLTAFVYFFGLTIPLVGPDEPRYAQVAREMYERGDWITPTLGGSHWFEKPALLYWLEMIAYNVFGVNEFAARIGPAVFGLGTILSLWLIGRFALKSTTIANWLGMIGATTIGILVFSRGASFDIIVTFPIAASLAGFIIYELNGKRQATALVAFYFFIGVALLAKGLIGAVFPIGIVSVYFLLKRQWPDGPLLRSFLWGIPLVLIVAATWYLPMYLRHGNEFINEFIVQQHFQRFTSNKYQHPQPFIFFFWVLPLMTIPWLPFFLAAMWKEMMRVVGRDKRLGERVESNAVARKLKLFAWCWLIVPLLFFSFSGSKLPGYILPAIPAAIILAALQALDLAKRGMFFVKMFQATATLTLMVVVATVIFFLPSFANDETDKWLIDAANQSGYSDLNVAGLFIISHNAEYYAAGHLIRDADGKQHKFYGMHEVLQYMESHDQRSLLVLVPNEYVAKLESGPHLNSRILSRNRELAIAVVSLR